MKGGKKKGSRILGNGDPSSTGHRGFVENQKGENKKKWGRKKPERGL